MKTQDAIEFFGSRAAVAQAARISRAAVAQWGDQVPLATALFLEKISDGRLVVDVDDYRCKPICSGVEANAA